MFKGVSPSDWECFQRLAIPHRYRPGDNIFYQGNRPLGLYFVCCGRVKLVKDGRFGRSQILRIIESPSILGDRAFFSETPYACTATVMDQAEICFLASLDFSKLFGQNAAMSRQITKHFALALGQAEEYMHCIATCTVIERMAAHLLAYQTGTARSQKSADGFILNESRKELAEILGTTPEAVSRALSALHSKRMIVIQGRHIRISNMERLSRVSCLQVKTC
ncbi:MAG: Crp/Fnr family transcriptional regulator [Elusimicrobiota bacterium]